MSEVIEEFQAVADDGTVHTIVKRQNKTSFRNMRGKLKIRHGGGEYFTGDGLDVTLEADGTFKIVLSGTILKPL